MVNLVFKVTFVAKNLAKIGRIIEFIFKNEANLKAISGVNMSCSIYFTIV